MDDIDRSQAQQEALLAAQLSAARSAVKPLPWVGCCYNCETITPEGVNFCDADCRADYDTRREAERREGR